ncbi:Zinc-type alcohol dehydrogenase-like protein [Paramyrothecium foliicola]|nr:Zinc-type alcohol dehydrogenase-like protein [Paramyrothecium foliicola]
MRSLILICLVESLLVAFSLAQAGDAPPKPAAQLPVCAARCLFSALSGGLCRPTDRICLCTDPTYRLNVTQCTAASCTIPEGLVARNISLTSCGSPVRDRSGRLDTSLWASVVLASFFVALRFLCKIFFISTATIGLDDWLTLATLVFGVSAAWVHIFGSIPKGLGKDIWTLEAEDITNFGAFFYHSCWTYFQASALLKLAMIAFYMRIFTQANVQRLLKGSFIFTTLYGVAFVITAIFQCRPIHYFWTGWDGLHEGTCANANAISWANAIGGIALDFWILGIPLWQLRYLQLHWKRKLAVAFMLIIGAAVTVVSILRLQSLVRFATSQNVTWDFYHIAIWSGLEVSIGIICTCLPITRLLLIKLFPRLGDPGSRGKGNYTYHSQERSGINSHEERTKKSFGNKSDVVSTTSPYIPSESGGPVCHRLWSGNSDKNSGTVTDSLCLLVRDIFEVRPTIYGTLNCFVAQTGAFLETRYSACEAKVKLVTEELPLPLHPTAVLIKVYAVALNYRDANIANGGNPWPVLPGGVPGNDAAGEIIAKGDQVSLVSVGNRVAPITDTEYVNARSTGRSWLAANEDGTLATYLIFDEKLVTKLPDHLDWIQASVIPCAGTTAWSALKGATIGQTVLIQGTGGVSTFSLKLARASGLRIILTSSSDAKLSQIKQKFGEPEIQTINYKTHPEWHEEVLRLTNGVGVDIVVENGGSSSLVKSMLCTRRGGTVSQVGYLGGSKPEHLQEFISTIIDRRINVRGINAGSKDDQDELMAAISATQMTFDDIIDSVWPFEKSEEAIEFVWQGNQFGKVVISFKDRA